MVLIKDSEMNEKKYLSEIYLYALFVLFELVNFGYHYGAWNHAALIPAIYHIMDPTLLANDIHAGHFPIYIRSLAWFIAQIGKTIPLSLVFFAFHVLSLLLLIYAIRKLTEELFPDQPLFAWFTLFIIVFYHYMPGDNLIIGGWILFEDNFYMYTLG